MTAVPPRSREPEPSVPRDDVDAVEVSTLPQGSIAVFQAPRPLASRTSAKVEPEWEEIESPFLGLVETGTDDVSSTEAAPRRTASGGVIGGAPALPGPVADRDAVVDRGGPVD